MLKNNNIRISNTPNVLNDATAEQAITLMLAAARNTVIGVNIAMGAAQDWSDFTSSHPQFDPRLTSKSPN